VIYADFTKKKKEEKKKEGAFNIQAARKFTRLEPSKFKNLKSEI
jgi:hypothetical protein